MENKKPKEKKQVIVKLDGLGMAVGMYFLYRIVKLYLEK